MAKLLSSGHLVNFKYSIARPSIGILFQCENIGLLLGLAWRPRLFTVRPKSETQTLERRLKFRLTKPRRRTSDIEKYENQEIRAPAIWTRHTVCKVRWPSSSPILKRTTTKVEINCKKKNKNKNLNWHPRLPEESI